MTLAVECQPGFDSSPDRQLRFGSFRGRSRRPRWSRYLRPLSLQLVWPVNKRPLIHVTHWLSLPFTARRIDVSRPAQSEVSRGLEGHGGCVCFLFLLLCLHLPPPPLSQRSHTSPFTRLEVVENVRVMGGCLTI